MNFALLNVFSVIGIVSALIVVIGIYVKKHPELRKEIEGIQGH